jgi:cell wall-associated NlpC family hydrolase
MVSQLLFGESFAVLDSRSEWLYVRSDADQYCGWVSANTVTLTEKFTVRPVDSRCVVTHPLAEYVLLPDRQTIYLPGGSLLPENYDKNFFVLAEKRFLKAQPVMKKQAEPDTAGLAGRYLNAPYLWGGKTILGIDCSGLVQVVFRMGGYSLPRDASRQEKEGREIMYEDRKTGDLAFFCDEEQKIVHVGIVCSPTEIIHASGKVRIDRLDRSGIFNAGENRYTHRLHSIKRIKDDI